MDNILKSPTEEKFRKINSNNPNFKDRCGDVVGGSYILETLGFKDVDGFWILSDVNIDLLNKIGGMLDAQINALG